MKLLQKIVNKFNGLHYPQEYLCLAGESLTHPLHACLVCNGQVIKDITKLHIFAGYNPLIFALSSLQEISGDQLNTIEILFTDKPLHPNETFTQKDAIAMLALKRMDEQFTGNDTICFFEGLKGQHHFLSSFHQWIIGLNNRLYNKKAGNVFLHDNLYKQVQIAYSLPRNISLITVSENDQYNLFPTDLHGQLDEQHYIISLRHEGKASRQVERTRKILVTEINSQFYKTVYSLGKNHTQEMKSKKNFPFTNTFSNHLLLPLPVSALYYRELELVNSFIYGIHRLFLFKILYRQQVQCNPSTLVHIHNVYATWRYNNRLPGNYLLR